MRPRRLRPPQSTTVLRDRGGRSDAGRGDGGRGDRDRNDRGGRSERGDRDRAPRGERSSGGSDAVAVSFEDEFDRDFNS